MMATFTVIPYRGMGIGIGNVIAVGSGLSMSSVTGLGVVTGLGILSRRRFSIARTMKASASDSCGGNDYNYYDVVSNFKWDVPKTFNFAQDVVDRHATEIGDNLAFHHVSEDEKVETKWTYSDLSKKSKETAVALNTLGTIKRAITVLPKVPEWWLINLSAMRTGTILLPGTTLLTASDLANRIVKSEADCVIGDAEVATKVEEEKHPTHLKHKILVSVAGYEDEESDLVNRRGWIPLKCLVEQNGASTELLEPVLTKSSDVMQIYFTSGTTGTPKMVPHTQGRDSPIVKNYS
jgi:medium-chain acyl-CoA synthetase